METILAPGHGAGGGTGSRLQKMKSVSTGWPPAARTSIAIHSGEPMKPTDFDHFLTARYRLYTMWGRRAAFAQIDHPPWPLHSARILRLEQNLIERSGVPPTRGAPVAHYSPDLKVRIGAIQLC